jgi:hypothetical protein
VRRRSLARALVAPVAAVGIAAGMFAAPAAQAQTVNIDTSGTVILTVPLSYLEALAKAGIVAFPIPASELSVNTSTQTATITTTVTGGDADVAVLYGSMDLSGKLGFAHLPGRTRPVFLGDLQLNIDSSQVVGTPTCGSKSIALLNVTGDITTSVTPGTTSTTDTYDSDDVVIAHAGASYLDSSLHTTAFAAGQTVGTLAATWTVVLPS